MRSAASCTQPRALKVVFVIECGSLYLDAGKEKWSCPCMFRGSFVALALLLITTEAHAGRRPFLFTWDTDAVNKGDVEIEQWLWARLLNEPANGADWKTGPSGGWLWFSPIYGLH